MRCLAIFRFKSDFFAVKLRPYSQAAENAAMAVLVASRWCCGTRLICGNELADADRLIPSKPST